MLRSCFHSQFLSALAFDVRASIANWRMKMAKTQEGAFGTDFTGMMIEKLPNQFAAEDLTQIFWN